MVSQQPPDHNMRERHVPFMEMPKCSCKEKRTISVKLLGPIKAEHTSKILHDPSCTIFTKEREERKNTIKISMRPFVNKTIELVFWSAFGAGGSSSSREIKSYKTVSRVLSPAFQKFESLNCLRWESSYEIFTSLMRYNAKSRRDPSVTLCNFAYKQSLLCDYPDDIMIASLDGLPEALDEIFRSGKAHPTDRDEFGNTLVHVSHHISLVLPA